MKQAIVKEFKTKPGYYFSHDDGTDGKGNVLTERGFQANQLVSYTFMLTYEDELGNVYGPFEKDFIGDSVISFGGATPYSVFNDPSNQDGNGGYLKNYFEIPLFIDGVPLEFDGGVQVTIPVYIGLKGDANLNNVVDAVDASLVLECYASVMVNEIPAPEFRINGVSIHATEELQTLACFLADVTENEFSPDNFAMPRSERTIDADDASKILSYYSEVSTGSPANIETWNKVLGR